MRPVSENQVSKLAHRLGKDQVWTTFDVGLILLVAATLRCWNLAAHGYDNLYYSPAVLSMGSDWRHFFFAAFDPAGFLAIGKPPVAFWIQALSVRLFGFNGFAIHLPQAIAGVFSVLLVFLLARRVTGVPGAALAASIVAVTPASVAADRSNLADSWLLLVLLGAAALILSASDTGSMRRLALGSVFVGVGFMTKFLAAFVALPALFLTYAIAAPIAFRRRLTYLGVATVVVTITSLIWLAAVDLTPKDRRPYIAETNDNSMLSLAFGFQGLSRILNRAATAVGNGGTPLGFQPGNQAPGPQATGPERAPGGDGPSSRFGHPGSPHVRGPSPQIITGHGGAPGFFRLANRDIAGHITWFFPVILVGAIATIHRNLPVKNWRQSHRDVFFWIVWFLTFATVFSLPRTFIHPYYLTLLAPAVAVLTAVAVDSLWAMRERNQRAIVLPVTAIVFTLLWHVRILCFYPPWARWLAPVLGMAGLLSVASLLLGRTPLVRRSALGFAGAAMFVSPLLWAATTALAPVGRMVPVADPTLLDYHKRALTEGARPTHIPTLVRFLQSNHHGERFILAVA